HHHMPVGLDGALRGSELMGNLLVEPAADHELEDLSLPWREPADTRPQSVDAQALRMQLFVTIESVPDRLEQLMPRNRLGQEVLCARLHDLHAGRDIAVAGNEYDRQYVAELD